MKPWMTDNQISLITKYLKPNDVMLEYGSGGSTICFSKYVKKYISIEHDKKWMDKIKYLLNQKNVELHYCSPNNNINLPVWQGKEEDFLDYINYIDNLSYKHYDVVLIDGRVRKFCAAKILNYISFESIVFVHDFFERPRYHDIYKHYNLIDKDDNKKQSLAVFKKKKFTEID